MHFSLMYHHCLAFSYPQWKKSIDIIHIETYIEKHKSSALFSLVTQLQKGEWTCKCAYIDMSFVKIHILPDTVDCLSLTLMTLPVGLFFSASFLDSSFWRHNTMALFYLLY